MWARLQTGLTVVCGTTMVASWLVAPQAKFGLALVAILAGSVFALRSAWDSIKDRSVDVNILMVLAAVGAVTLGHFGEAAILLFLFSLSNTLETYALGRTKSAIEGLVKLRPDTAVLVTESGDQETDVRSIQTGDRVRILPYATIPLDGEIEAGDTHVDQAAMTGESAAVSRGVGDVLLAGTQNLEGSVTIRVTSPAGQTTLDKVVELVADAQENKASGERVSAWFGQTYTWLVIAAFGVSFGVRLVLGEAMSEAAYGALALLVALSPCALVISTPATTLSALAWAAKNGILIRGGQFIEACGSVDTVFVDKTGTLTKGRPVLSEICICSEVPVNASVASSCGPDHACWHGGEMGEESRELLAIAAGAEQYSTHPIAEAIVAGARARGIDVPEATSVEVVPGKGVLASVRGAAARIGQPSFFESFPPGFQFHADKMRDAGMTVAILQRGDEFAAIGLRDEVRAEAAAFVPALKSMGVKGVRMLTGDNPVTAKVVHDQVATDGYHASLLPSDKEQIVAEAVDRGQTVMFVGDGINDAPSLAKAHVGVAMGGLGSDVALNAADIVLMQDRLDLIPRVLALGKKTNRIVRTNLVFAATVIVGLTVMTFVLGQVAPRLADMVLPFAVVGHEGSTVLVILNGLRLLRGPNRVS